MNKRLQELMIEAGTDCSGKWLGHDNIEKLLKLFTNEIESYIKESEGDIDYVRFLMDKNLK